MKPFVKKCKKFNLTLYINTCKSIVYKIGLQDFLKVFFLKGRTHIVKPSRASLKSNFMKNCTLPYIKKKVRKHPTPFEASNCLTD